MSHWRALRNFLSCKIIIHQQKYLKTIFLYLIYEKSTVIISFAFIFLLSVSFVSANFFDWLTGDVTRSELAGWIKVDKAGGGECYVKTETAKLSGISKEEISNIEDAFERSIINGGGDPLAMTCVTTCGEVTCTKWGSHPTGWCCICLAHHQSCTTTCTGGEVEVETEEE